MDIFSELEDIGRMLVGASMLAMVRQEMAALKRDGLVVTDGSHQEGCGDYEVVVRCGSYGDLVARRLRDRMPDVDVSSIADGVVGLKSSRRSEDGE
jgi:hypothetical protein